MTNYPNNSICILNNTLNSGGAEKNCVIICNELAKRNVVVELWITKLENSPLINLLDKRVKVVPIPGKKIRYTFFHLKELMVKKKSTTLLIFNIELLIPAFFISKLYRLNTKIITRSISTLSLVYNKNENFKKFIWFYLIKYSANRISSIIAQSLGMKQDLIEYFKIKESKIKLIPNPAYNFIFNNDTEKEVLPIWKEILFVGRLTEAKGLQYLIEIFVLTLQRIPDVHLRIVGTGELENKLKKQVQELGLTQSVHFEGFQTDLSHYYKNAIVTVLTSIREGFPNVLVESISCGTPIIAFDCPSGPKEIIIPNINGILIEYLNVNDFADAIINTVSGNFKFDKNKVIESSKRYNLDKIIQQYQEVLFG